MNTSGKGEVSSARFRWCATTPEALWTIRVAMLLEVVIVRSGAGLQTHIRTVRDLPVGERHVLRNDLPREGGNFGPTG